MEDVIVRSRYPRRTYSRRKKRTAREGRGLIKIIARQTLICILILMIVGIIKNLNYPASNYLEQGIKWVLYQNIDAKSIYDNVQNIADKIIHNSLFTNQDNGDSDSADSIDGNAVPASAGVSEPTDTGSESSQKENTAQQDNELQTDSKYTFIVPVNGKLGDKFGERVNTLKKTTEFHNGIDIEAEKGASIVAAQDGEVQESGSDSTYGSYIKIKHSDGFTTLYAHCSTIIAKKGQKVKQGEIIAKVGGTGLSIGDHLHFEIWKDGKPVDPLKYVKVPEK